MEMRLPSTVLSALRRLSGALLFQERHYSCSALIQTLPAAQAGVGKVPGRGSGLFFFLSLNLSESASAERSRNLPASARGISSAGRRSGTARVITGIFGPENVHGRAQIQLCPVCV